MKTLLFYLRNDFDGKRRWKMSTLSDLQSEEHFNLALIATYPELARIVEEMAKQQDFGCQNIYASFDEAAAKARQIEPQVDAILSRGGTAEYIRRAVEIPVIAIPISPFDVVRSMYDVRTEVKEVSFFNFQRKIYGIREIEKMFHKVIHEYTFINENDIIEGVKDVKARGIQVLIGGFVAAQLAQKEGMEGIEIRSGEEAVYRAMLEAIHVAKVRRSERSRAARLKMAFDSITEGIIVTDEQSQVVSYNPSAERIFRLPAREVIGRKVEDVIPNTRMHKVLATGQPEMDCLQEIHGGIIATNRLPIFLDEKPIGVVSTFEDVTKIQQLEQQIRKKIHAKGFVARYHFADIKTNNARMIELKEVAALYATSQSAVLLEGESGTGKELFAQSIHNASKRVNGPFIAVNCAAIPEQLLESELFGYEGGAFTGAKKEGKQGLFELAHNGTIFLDEIGEIPEPLQARLLRVLQEREIMRVGGDKIIPVDIRIISATNKKLEQKIAKSEFRDDLYYRLNVYNLKIPPLRERKDDIMLLGNFFLENLGITVDEKVMQELQPALLGYDWPGNIRELYNVMDCLSLLVSNPRGKTYLKETLNKLLAVPAAPTDNVIWLSLNIDQKLKTVISQVEKVIIDTLLIKYGHDQEKVAEKLAIGHTTLWRKLKADKK
jgi:propionate catabolism operon transcriptional regulator